MRVAIVGAGVSGLVAAHRLHRDHEVTVLEASDWIGGHAHAVDVELDDGVHVLDTGFLVFNEPGYPYFTRLMKELRVLTQASDMSFSVSSERTGLEYGSRSLSALFAQRRNVLNPKFHRLARDIVRFFREAREILLEGSAGDSEPSLGEWLRERGYSPEFIEHHIVPMGAAIWSARQDAILAFPARYFARFFAQHGFLQVRNRQPWRCVVGSSRRYVETLTRPFASRIHASTAVRRVERHSDHVTVRTDTGAASFDHVILAVHADQALALLGDPTQAEREILSAIPYQENDVVLHHDERLLPRSPRAWSSWNHHVLEGGDRPVAITYYLNLLQRLQSHHHFCVTLNRSEAIRPERVLGRYSYRHPIYSARAFAAQARLPQICGAARTSYCGAWGGWGFHEDGVASAESAVARLRAHHEKLSLPRLGQTPAA